VRLLDWRSHARRERGEPAGADADLDRILVIDPVRGADACRKSAWRLSTGPPGRRDDARALKLARKAVRAQSEDAACARVLGLALVRAGRPEEALEVHDGNSGSGGAGMATDRLVEALALVALDRPEQARAWIEAFWQLRSDGSSDDSTIKRLHAEVVSKLVPSR
jgi:hypothetical protein